MRRFLRESMGQSMIEMALALPMMTFLLVGGADLARAFAVQLAVQNGARAGAEAYAIDFTPTTAETAQHAVQEMNRTPGMDATNATITVTRKQSDGVTNCPQTPDPAVPCYVTVRVQYTFRTIIAWPFIPNVFNFDRTTIIRTFV
jgi:Flp pilus assembly protein TadG